MKRIYGNKLKAFSGAAILSFTMLIPSYSLGYVASTLPEAKIYTDTNVKEEVVQKELLNYENAIKKAINYSITNKSAELKRETLQDKIDELDYKYDALFEIKDPDVLEGTIANLEIYNKSLSTNRDLMLRQKTVDSESLKITIAGIFNNIEQQLKSISLTQKKISQADANIRIYQTQYDLGMVSKNELDNEIVSNKALRNDLELLKIKLREYYAELEKNTGMENISEKYEIIPLEMEYKELSISETDLNIYKANIENFDIAILSKKNEVENKTATFENYTQLYNFQYLSWLAGSQSAAPNFDYKSTRDEKNVAELDLSQTLENARLNLDKNYATLQQIQQNIAIMKLELDKMDINMKPLDIKYELGAVSKNEYENTLISRGELKNQLDGLMVQQKQLKMLFESPYFAGMQM